MGRNHVVVQAQKRDPDKSSLTLYLNQNVQSQNSGIQNKENPHEVCLCDKSALIDQFMDYNKIQQDMMKVEDNQTNRVEDDQEAITFGRAHSLSDVPLNKPNTDLNVTQP